MSGYCDPAEVNGGPRCPQPSCVCTTPSCESCVDSDATSSACPGGGTQCAGGCIDTQTDPNNCGDCGLVCPGSAPCVAGNCVALVDAGTDAMGVPETSSPEAGDDAGTPPSCAPGGPGMTNCGPGGSGTESCCTSLEVTGGTYFRTYDETDSGFVNPPADGGPAGEADPATVSSFRLDKYVVTVGRFRQFVNAVLPLDGGAGWSPSPGSGKHLHLNNGNGLAATGGGYEPGWVASDDSQIAPTNANLVAGYPGPGGLGTSGAVGATWTALAGSQENLPINEENWYEAYAFCIWDGGFLPSEAEWEYAAAGGSQQREYPWGSTPPGTANQYAIYGCLYPSMSITCTLASMAPVGTAILGAGRWGQLDLAGDVWEWNLDWYAAYAACTDCADFTLGIAMHALRGGGAAGNSAFLPPPYRDNTEPSDYREDAIGFRCARTP
jgi:formylglycine-generating enzyme required for sulfatase activity